MRKGSGRIPDCHPDRKYESRGMCKQCYTKWYNENNSDKVRKRIEKYRENNREMIRETHERWKKNNPEKVVILRNRYRAKNSKSLLERHRDYNSKNRETINVKSKEYRDANPEKRIETKLNARYKLTIREYQEMYDNQNGLCAICGGISSNGRRLCVDHNHDNGKIRALLCDNCNVGIGRFKDDKNMVYKAYLYLEKHDND